MLQVSIFNTTTPPFRSSLKNEYNVLSVMNRKARSFNGNGVTDPARFQWFSEE